MNRAKLEKILFGTILLLLFMPMAQQEYQFIKVGKLDGYDPSIVQDSVRNWANWTDGSYQEAKEKYRNYFFGFRPWFIRLNNQLDYSLYRGANAYNIVVGKNHYLYGIDYVKAYKGLDFVGEDVIQTKIKRFKMVQDTLQKLGKHIFFIITPNKADYYAEYLPDRDQIDQDTVKTNYDYYIRAMDKAGIQYIDLHKWFLDIKDTVAYPVFPQTGIHLTYYGSALFTDTLINYLETITNKDLADFSWSKIDVKDVAYDTDDDAERALNLMFRLPYFPLPYPDVKFNSEGKYKPTSLAVGDSFYWQFIMWRGMYEVFDDGRFWYYNEEAHPYGPDNVRQLDFGKNIMNKDVIFIVNSSFNLWRFGFNFDLDLYKYFFKDQILANKDLLDELIQEQIKAAHDDKKWLAFIQKQADERGEPFDKVLYDNAMYMVKQRLMN